MFCQIELCRWLAPGPIPAISSALVCLRNIMESLRILTAVAAGCTAGAALTYFLTKSEETDEFAGIIEVLLWTKIYSFLITTTVLSHCFLRTRHIVYLNIVL